MRADPDGDGQRPFIIVENGQERYRDFVLDVVSSKHGVAIFSAAIDTLVANFLIELLLLEAVNRLTRLENSKVASVRGAQSGGGASSAWATQGGSVSGKISDAIMSSS
jgi:hypothetical protein